MKQTKFKETEIGRIPQEWEVRDLQECCDLIIDYRGKTPKKLGSDWSQKGVRALSARNVKDGCIVNEGSIKYVDIALYKKWMRDEICDGDILLTSEGPMGESLLWDSEEKIVLSQRLFGIRAKKAHIYPKYLYAYMASPIFRDELVSRGTGTTVEGIRQSELIKTRIIVPEYIEQKGIGDFLYQLNKKIVLNQEMNRTLEAIGQALFKHWFVDFEFPDEKGRPYKSSGGKMIESELGEIPEGWRVGKTGEIIDITSGKRPEEKSDNQDVEFQIPLIGASSVMGYVKQPLYDEPIIIIGRVGTHGIVQRVVYPSFPSDNTLVIKSKFYEYVYQVLNHVDYDSLNVGTTQPLITQSGIKGIRVIIPSDYVLNQFENIASSLFTKSEHNKNETHSLSQIRNSLLPRLMSGRIRVKVG